MRTRAALGPSPVRIGVVPPLTSAHIGGASLFEPEAEEEGECFQALFGGRSRIRTYDPLIKSQLLYQLSYAPAWAEAAL